MTTSLGTVFVIDDDPGIRLLVQRILERHGIAIHASATLDRFFLETHDQHPACILLDIRLGSASGLDLLHTLRSRNIATPVIMMTGFASIPVAVECMQRGASDFIEKPFKSRDLVAKVLAALDKDRARLKDSGERRAIVGRLASLTRREVELLQAIADGKSGKMIARDFGISPRTVEHHRSNMLARTGAQNLAQLVRMAVECGMIIAVSRPKGTLT